MAKRGAMGRNEAKMLEALRGDPKKWFWRDELEFGQAIYSQTVSKLVAKGLVIRRKVVVEGQVGKPRMEVRSATEI